MSRKSKFRNNPQYTALMNQYRMLGTSIFEWEGLEDLDIPAYEPENTLYNQGQACMIQVPGTDSYAILPVAYGSVQVDIYGRPISWRAYAVGATPIAQLINTKEYSTVGIPGTEPSVLIWNNYMRTGTEPYVSTIVDKMVNVDIALTTNINIQKCPFIVNCNQQNQLTAKNFYKQIQEGAGAIFQSSDMDGISIEVLGLNVPFIGAELSDQYRTYENRLLEYIGINNLPVEKQERMLTGEVSSNDDKTELMFESRLYMRERACKEMEELFGITVSVKKRELQSANTQPMSGALGSGGESGDVGEEDGTEQRKD